MSRKKTTYSTTYYRIAELSNGAVISQPYCNIENKFHISTTENGKHIGILVQCLKNCEKGRHDKIVFVYKNGRNLCSPRFTYSYRTFIDNCINEALNKEYIHLYTNYNEEMKLNENS